ncbi:putative Phosphatidylinositol 3-kinase, nodule [Blattamonas nauphoetae]|uniref:Phosphatidylinositol 3-kinase, nodule n=1 Tax=Blattamonas nauphoetae TaxID=2049346 RepID=A0ABQ9XT60_9EUKA|nr:putative Phosphatidylinositol 3-kinase, nodule [Blattamonas nauphoetae]
MEGIELQAKEISELLPETVLSSFINSDQSEEPLPLHASQSNEGISNTINEPHKVFHADNMIFGSSSRSPWNSLPFISSDSELNLIQPSLRFTKLRRIADSSPDQSRITYSHSFQNVAHGKVIPAVPWMDEIASKSMDFISSEIPQVSSALMALQVEFLKYDVGESQPDFVSFATGPRTDNLWYLNIKPISIIDSLGRDTIPLQLRFATQDVEAKLHTISLYPPQDNLQPSDREFLWTHRYLASKYPSLIYPFIQSVDWKVPAKHNEALVIIESWRSPTLSCIFEILSHPFWENDLVLRMFAIKHLSELPNDELMDYLPQLTQCLLNDPIWDSSWNRPNKRQQQDLSNRDKQQPQPLKQKTASVPDMKAKSVSESETKTFNSGDYYPQAPSPSHRDTGVDGTSAHSRTSTISSARSSELPSNQYETSMPRPNPTTSTAPTEKLLQSKSFAAPNAAQRGQYPLDDAMSSNLQIAGSRPITSQSFSTPPSSFRNREERTQQHDSQDENGTGASLQSIGEGQWREPDVANASDMASEFEGSTASGMSTHQRTAFHTVPTKTREMEMDADHSTVSNASIDDSRQSDLTTNDHDNADTELSAEPSQYRPPLPPSSLYSSNVTPPRSSFDSNQSARRRIVIGDEQRMFLNDIGLEDTTWDIDMPLTSFLFERAGDNVEIFCLLYWNLHVMKEIETNSSVTLAIINLLFDHVHERAPFMIVFIYRQVLLLQKIQTAFEKTAGIPRQERIERMKIEAQDFFSPNEPFPSPVNPRFWLSQIFPDKILIFKSKVLPVLARFKGDSTDEILEPLMKYRPDGSVDWGTTESLNGKFGITQALVDLSLARLKEREELGEKLVSDEMIEQAKQEEEKEKLAQLNQKEEEAKYQSLTVQPPPPNMESIPISSPPLSLPQSHETFDQPNYVSPHPATEANAEPNTDQPGRTNQHKQNLQGTGYDDNVIMEDDIDFDQMDGEDTYDTTQLDSFGQSEGLQTDEASSQQDPSPSEPQPAPKEQGRVVPIAPPSMPQIDIDSFIASRAWKANEKEKQDDFNHSFMYKSLDDVRQDMLCVQIVSVFDRLFKSENLDLKLSPYQVVAIGANPPLGLIEFVPSKSIERIKLEDQSIANYFRSHNRDDSSPLGYPPEVLDNFIRSCAGYSVITFLLTVGDRHLDNLLVTPDGKMFHVDFGMFLGHDVKFRPSPMKLSKEMIDCMGGIDSSHFRRFISLCCEAYSIARRKGANLILSLFRMMRKAKIPDLEDARGLTLVLMKFKLELTEGEANSYILQQIEKSTSAFFPSMVDKIHIFAQSWRN